MAGEIEFILLVQNAVKKGIRTAGLATARHDARDHAAVQRIHCFADVAGAGPPVVEEGFRDQLEEGEYINWRCSSSLHGF